jgi:ABC-type uncharacterized transport system auxiliary subunit
MKSSIFFLSIIIPIFFLGACRSSKPVAPTFYVLEFPTDRIPEEKPMTLPYSLEITDIDLHPAFATHQIAIREDQHEIRYFSNHEWAVRPDQSLTRFISDYFKNVKIFKNTDTRYWNIQPDYKLLTSVHQLEVLKDGNDYLAHVHFDFRLVMTEGSVTVVRHSADKTRLLERRNLNLFAGAVNDMFFEELHFFARKILYEFSAE